MVGVPFPIVRSPVHRRFAVIAASVVAGSCLLALSANAGTDKRASALGYQVIDMGYTGGEPSVSYEPIGDAAFYAAGTTVKKVHVSLSGKATMTDVSPPFSPITLDTIGVTDPRTHRTFISYLDLACSVMAFTDSAGQDWNQSTGCGLGAAVDHQTVGVGPLHAPLAGTRPYDGVVYYCAQDSYNGQCAVSLDGGFTFGPGVPVANTPINSIGDVLGGRCSALHGHIRVGPDGTAYLPLKGCGGVPTLNNLTNSEFRGGVPSLSVSENNGVSWEVRLGPKGAKNPDESDPSVAIGPRGTVYLGWQDGPNDDDTQGGPQTSARVAISKDHGKSWSKMTDLSTPLGLRNVQFPEMIVGDDSRAAFSFIATPGYGNDQDNSFKGDWHLYVSTTYDSGTTWKTVDITPKDPINRGCVHMTGLAPGTQRVDACDYRNMLDFNDITVDKFGRPFIAYTDACVKTCQVTPGAHPDGKQLKLAVQTSGRGLYQHYDKLLLRKRAF